MAATSKPACPSRRTIHTRRQVRRHTHPALAPPTPGSRSLTSRCDLPDFKFNRPLYHPNIYKDGKLCISILHAPGDDEMSGESSGERWSPVQRVESVLLSIVSLLDDAECSSPANVDAGVTLRKDPARYRALVAADVAASKQDIPAGFQMPTGLEKPPPAVEKHDDSDFWCESEQEDFGGSDTDEEMTQDEAEDEREDEDEDEEEEDEEMTEKYDVHEEEEEL